MQGHSGSPATPSTAPRGVHHDRVHAVARLDDAPAHFLDDACLHAPAYDIGMPELPELEALVEALDPLVTRAPVRDVPVAHFAVVKTATPPLDWLAGHSLTGAVRRGKHLLFPTDEDLDAHDPPHDGGQAGLRRARARSARPAPCSSCASRTTASSSSASA